MKHYSKGSIILVNGTSSSGKSSVLAELEKIMPHAAYLHVDDYYDEQVKQTAVNLGWKENSAIDPWHFINQYLINKTGKYYFDTQVREQLFTATDFFYSKAKLSAQQGKMVFIDTVLEYASAYQEAFKYFKPNNFSMILIYCPMSLILERVQKRNISGTPREYRSPFLPFEHFITMYKLRENSQQALVDTLNTKILQDTLKAAIQDLIDQKIAKEFLPKLEQFKNNFIKEFKLDTLDEIQITPRYEYKAIYKNAAPEDPSLIAEEIKKHLEKL